MHNGPPAAAANAVLAAVGLERLFRPMSGCHPTGSQRVTLLGEGTMSSGSSVARLRVALFLLGDITVLAL